MIWSYRAVNNKIARRKWLTLGAILILLGAIYTVYRTTITGKIIQSLAILTLFFLMVFLYTVITLGKTRYYFVEDDKIVYKPFRTKIDEIEGYEIDENNLVVKLRLKKPKIFAVKTLYFDKREEFEDVLRFLKRKIG